MVISLVLRRLGTIELLETCSGFFNNFLTKQAMDFIKAFIESFHITNK